MLLLEIVGGLKKDDVVGQDRSQVYFPEWTYNKFSMIFVLLLVEMYMFKRHKSAEMPFLIRYISSLISKIVCLSTKGYYI